MGLYALPEILMRRLSAGCQTVLCVYGWDARGQDKSVLLDDLEGYEVIFFDPYWTLDG